MKHLTPILVTAVAVVIGTLLANVIAKQVPALSTYEEDEYEEE